MRRFLLPCLMLALGALALAAPAQAQGLPAGTNLSWEALDPGDDWSARVIRSGMISSLNLPAWVAAIAR